MPSILIRTDNIEHLELITKLAKKLGINVSDVTDEQSEDLALGNIMLNVKTGKRDTILKDSILNFKVSEPSSFGDAAEWEQRQRSDRELPFL